MTPERVLFELSQQFPSKTHQLAGLMSDLCRSRHQLGSLRCFGDSDLVTVVKSLDRHGYVGWADRVIENAYPIDGFVTCEDLEPLDHLRLRRRVHLGCRVPQIHVEYAVIRRHDDTIGKSVLGWLKHFDIAIAAKRHDIWKGMDLYFRTDADAVHAKLAFHDIFYE